MSADPPAGRKGCPGCPGCLLVLVALPVLLLAWGYWNWQFPSEAEVNARFLRSRPALERLVALLAADPTVEFVTEERLERKGQPSRPIDEPSLRDLQHEQFQRELKAANVWAASGPYQRFPFDGFGWMGEGWRMGFQFCPEPPPAEKIVPTFEGIRRRGIQGRHAYRHLDGPWYVWLVW